MYYYTAVAMPLVDWRSIEYDMWMEREPVAWPQTLIKEVECLSSSSLHVFQYRLTHYHFRN
jgi:hypothetical protein